MIVTLRFFPVEPVPSTPVVVPLVLFLGSRLQFSLLSLGSGQKVDGDEGGDPCFFPLVVGRASYVFEVRSERCTAAAARTRRLQRTT